MAQEKDSDGFVVLLRQKLSTLLNRSEDESAPELPDTAKDMFGDPDSTKQPIKQVEKTDKGFSAPDELPHIDFKAKTPKKEPEKIPEFHKKEEHQILPDSSRNVPPPIEDEIRQFESAVSNIYSGSAPDVSEAQNTNIDRFEHDSGFFSEFQKFLEGNEIPKIAGEIVGKDLLEKMKEYHMHRQEGKPYFFHTSELQNAVRNTMLELRELENEWYLHRERISKEEEYLMDKEGKISDKVRELEYLMEQMRNRDEFMRDAPGEKYFQMSNGQKLRSLSDLATALRLMPDEIFRKHVDTERNDFATWVEHVFGKPELANKLKSTFKKKDMYEILSKMIKGDIKDSSNKINDDKVVN